MRALVSVLVVVVPGCGDDGAAPDAPVTGDPAAVAHFDPPARGAGDWGDVPWPSDLFLDENDRIAIGALPVGPAATTESLTMLREGLATLSGAGLRSNVYFPIDLAAGADLDPATLAGAGALIDLETGEPIETEILWRADLGAVVLVPRLGTVLRHDHRYGAYLTSAIETTGGGPLAADDAFAGHASVAPVLDALPAATRDAVVVATVFETARFPLQTLRMRDAVAALPPPVTVLDVVDGDAELDAVLGDGAPDTVPGLCIGAGRVQPHSHVGALIHGRMTLTSFLSDTINVDGFPEYDIGGAPIVKGQFPVDFTLGLPATTADWNALPVMIYVHGINGTRNHITTLVDTAGRLGVAVLAIDLPYHGHRARRSADQHDTGNETLGTATPDGFGDSDGLFPATALFHQSSSGGIPAYHPRATGENLRQAAVEVLQLVAFVRDGDDSALEAAMAPIAALPDTFQFRDDVALMSESLGGMISGVALALDPSIGVAYLSSPAAGFPEPSLLHSPNHSASFAAAMTGPYDIADRIDVTDPARDYRVDPAVMLVGNVVERGDAIAYAPLVASGELRAGPPRVVVGMAWGDVWVSNDTTEAYVKALGLPQSTLALAAPPADTVRYVELEQDPWPAENGCFVVFHPAGHGALRHFEEQRNHEPTFPPYVPVEPPTPIFPTQVQQIHELWGELLSQHFDAAPGIALSDPYADVDNEIAGAACP